MSEETPDVPDPPQEEPDPQDVPEESWADLAQQVPESTVLLGFAGVLKFLDAGGDVCVQVLHVGVHTHEALGMAMVAQNALTEQLACAGDWADQDQEGPDL